MKSLTVKLLYFLIMIFDGDQSLVAKTTLEIWLGFILLDFKI